MKRIAAIFLAVWPLSVSAHPCPFDWNIEFSEGVNISGENIEDFANKFNEAVSKQTKEKIPKAIIYTVKPDSFAKVPVSSPFASEMDTLIKRYSEVTAPLIKKGVFEYGGAPKRIEFPANFPVACILSSPNTGAVNYEETKDGLKITIHRELECRAYHVSPKFLEVAKDMQSRWQIPAGSDHVSYFFARMSEMMWAFHTMPDPDKDAVEEPILSGVTLYIPEKRVILAIETKEKHEEIIKNMLERGYLESPIPEEADRK
jgi:hypothetical protein